MLELTHELDSFGMRTLNFYKEKLLLEYWRIGWREQINYISNPALSNFCFPVPSPNSLQNKPEIPKKEILTLLYRVNISSPCTPYHLKWLCHQLWVIRHQPSPAREHFTIPIRPVCCQARCVLWYRFIGSASTEQVVSDLYVSVVVRLHPFNRNQEERKEGLTAKVQNKF